MSNTQIELVDVTTEGISIRDPDGRTLAHLPLAFSVGQTTWTVSSTEETPTGWLGATSDPAVTVLITRHPQHLCVELRGAPAAAANVTYFRGSRLFTSHLHAFIPDDHFGCFPTETRTFTLTNQASMRKHLGLKETLWMIAPQPHVIGCGTPTGAGFCFSIPECLTSDAVQFVIDKTELRIDFLHYVAERDQGRFPRVYIAPGVASRAEMLDRHRAHAQSLGLVASDKPRPDWWHNPIYCTWGDQVYLRRHGVEKDDALSRERILGWADKIRTFYDGEVNFIIDAGYFRTTGDFRLRPDLYPTEQAFIDLIAELKRRRFRVILWYTPFWAMKDAAVVTEHPDWLLKGHDGKPLDFAGDWSERHFLDWSNPAVRDNQLELIRHFLVDYDADGFKIDMNFSHPATQDIQPHDPTWAAGNQFPRRVFELIHTHARSIKPDAFITTSSIECYLQPFTSAIRLNDLFNMTDPFKWYQRAELVTRLMPGVAIDVDGWPAAPAKLREYPFVASVYGAPVAYYIDGTEIGDVTFSDVEINRIASVWATYDNAPVRQGDRILIDTEAERFERRGPDGALRAVSLVRRAFVTYGRHIRVTANCDMAVAVPLEGRPAPTRCERCGRDGTRTPVPLHVADSHALFYAHDAGKGVLYYELS